MATKLTLEQIVDSINYWMASLRDEDYISDIEDAISEMSDTIKASGFTRDEVYRAFRKQFES